MAVGDAYVFPGFLTPVLTQLFFPKPPTTFLTCFCRGERRKYAGKKSRLNRGSNSQPPGHESDTLTTEPSGRGFSHSIFGTFGELSNIFNKFKIVICKLFKFWKNLKFVIWEGVKKMMKLVDEGNYLSLQPTLCNLHCFQF